jgi:hypothetical protein
VSGSRTPFSKTRRGKLESVVDIVLLEDSVVAEDFVLASERNDFRDCDELDSGSFPGFLPCPPILSNTFKFSFVRRARFGDLWAPDTERCFDCIRELRLGNTIQRQYLCSS